GLAGGDQLDLHAEALGHRRPALELDQALARPRHADTAAAPEARGLSGLRFEALVEDGSIAGEPGQVVARAELADEPRRVPGGATGEIATLEQHDLAPPEHGQGVSDATTHHAAPADDDARVRRNRAGHPPTIS